MLRDIDYTILWYSEWGKEQKGAGTILIEEREPAPLKWRISVGREKEFCLGVTELLQIVKKKHVFIIVTIRNALSGILSHQFVASDWRRHSGYRLICSPWCSCVWQLRDRFAFCALACNA